ncbi:MAG: GNAT family N-acetyltransferase [Oscillospiraceae bacterium]|nr:GNAT family N-acetyltransferase [Oscillospiraceae bacterium]
MRFERYADINAFSDDVLEILLENEVQNNLPVSFINNSLASDTSKWLLGAVKDDHGSILLVVARTPPFNIVLYETRNIRNDAAVKLLSDELKSMEHMVPGVVAAQGLAQRFADEYTQNGYSLHLSMNIMRLDIVTDIAKAPGRYRTLREEDLYFVPFWERAFSEDCGTEAYEIKTIVERLRGRLGKDTHYIWVNGHPVSQAVHGRSTQNGAVVNMVYTPPHYRNKGYASSVVAELSVLLLERGNKFCCLFADAANPISCGIYRKIGYRDLCVYDELVFSPIQGR